MRRQHSRGCHLTITRRLRDGEGVGQAAPVPDRTSMIGHGCGETPRWVTIVWERRGHSGVCRLAKGAMTWSIKAR